MYVCIYIYVYIYIYTHSHIWLVKTPWFPWKMLPKQKQTCHSSVAAGCTGDRGSG